MEPYRLIIENFMNHMKSDIDCSGFDSALIVGKNKDNERESNGVGKTSIFSAIEYVIFNEVPTSTLDKIVREGSKKCRVEFQFKLKEKFYKIIRSRSAKGKADLFLHEWNDSWVDISGKSPSDTEKTVKDLIKISQKAFHHSILFPQEDVSNLASVKPDERLKILKEPLNLHKYTKLEDIANKKLKPIKSELDFVNKQIFDLGSPEGDIKHFNETLENIKKEISNKKENIESLNKRLSDKNSYLDSLKQQLEGSDLESYNKISELEKKQSSLESSKNKKQKEINELENKKNSTGKELEHMRKSFSETKEKYDLEKEKNVRSTEVISEQLEKVRNDEMYGTKLLATYEAEYKQANMSVPEDDFCPSCKQPITEEHREDCKKEIQEKLNSKQEAINSTKKNLEKCRRKKEKLESELEETNKYLKSLEKLSSNIENTQIKIDNLLEQLSDFDSRIKKEQNELNNISHELKEVISKLVVLRKNMEESSVSELNKQINNCKSEIKGIEEKIKDYNSEISNLHVKKGGIMERIKTREKDKEKLSELKDRAKELSSKLEIHRMVARAFSPKGIPTFIIHTILDELQHEANVWLEKLRPELSIQFDKDLEIMYMHNGASRTFKQLSGGQKVYITFALKIALSRIIQHKMGIDIKFLVLDEVDQSLDKAGVDAFADVVKKLQDDFKVFIITHNDDLKHRFSHAILVENDLYNGATSRLVSNW